MNNYLPALIQSLVLYLLLSLSYYGWGRMLTRILRIKEQSNLYAAINIWLGWAVTLFIFQILHLFISMTAFVVAPIFIIGILFSLKSVVYIFKIKPPNHLTILKLIPVFLTLFTIVVWIASRSMVSPTNYDTGLYHLNSIRWIESYPIILGLGNLHYRLAFNQSFFLYAAALNFHPFFDHGSAIANSYLFLLTFATMIGFLSPAIKQPSILVQSHPFKFLPAIFVLPPLGYLALTSNGLASPSPDLASTLLQVTMFIILTYGIAEWLDGVRYLNHLALLLTLLAATSVTIKLSNLAFATVILIFVLIYTWPLTQKKIRELIFVFSPATLMVIVWCLSGFLLSGAPLFPSTIGYIPVVWAVPKERIIDAANWIYSWAREPEVYYTQVLGNWNWLKPWLWIIFHQSTTKLEIVYPLVLSVLLFLITGFILLFNIRKSIQILEWAILIPVILTLIYWFFTAPDPRFANASFFLLALSMLLLFLITMKKRVKKRVYIALLCLAFVIGNLQYVNYAITNRWTLKYISLSGYQAIPETHLVQMETTSGLLVYSPENGDQCWDAPLPCTPYFDLALMLRTPGNLGSGFELSR